jgi:hypothetical protein
LMVSQNGSPCRLNLGRWYRPLPNDGDGSTIAPHNGGGQASRRDPAVQDQVEVVCHGRRRVQRDVSREIVPNDWHWSSQSPHHCAEPESGPPSDSAPGPQPCRPRRHLRWQMIVRRHRHGERPWPEHLGEGEQVGIDVAGDFAQLLWATRAGLAVHAPARVP